MRSRIAGQRRSTPPQTCTVPIPNASGIPVPCGDRRFRAGRCVVHWTDWKQARESRRGTSRVNPARREMRTLMRELGLGWRPPEKAPAQMDPLPAAHRRCPMTLDYQVTPLPPIWPGKATPSYARKRPQFKTITSRALSLLAREIRYLGGKNIEIAVDAEPRHIRADGLLRADARPRSSAIVVSFTTRDGRLQFPCDTFTYWEENVDAVARALEALRMVDRYGVQQGRQYAGFKALPSGTAPTMTSEAAAKIIALYTHIAHGTFTFRRGEASAVLASSIAARDAIRAARAGSTDAFAQVETARAVLEAHFGGDR